MKMHWHFSEFLKLYKMWLVLPNVLVLVALYCLAIVLLYGVVIVLSYGLVIVLSYVVVIISASIWHGTGSFMFSCVALL